MQAIGRWGNYFNQELYGPPTTLPWGIPIDCAHRLQDVYSCTVIPEATRFHPLFLYESISGVLGAIVLIWLGFRFRSQLRPGDLLLVFLIWYGATRFVLENLRADNWTFFGIPTAQIVSLVGILIGVGGLIYRHRRGHPADRPPAFPQNASWGALGAEWMTRPIDEPWANVPPPKKEAVDWDAIIDADDDVPAGDAAAATEPPHAAEPDAPIVPDAPDAHEAPDEPTDRPT
jgi:hypothetical protein